jgi:hypothetical protein
VDLRKKCPKGVTLFTDVFDDWNVQKNAQGIVAMWGSGGSPISTMGKAADERIKKTLCCSDEPVGSHRRCCPVGAKRHHLINDSYKLSST